MVFMVFINPFCNSGQHHLGPTPRVLRGRRGWVDAIPEAHGDSELFLG